MNVSKLSKLKTFFKNRWVKFSLATAAYLLLCVVWTGNLWMLLGLPLIYDIFISKLFYKYIWRRNDELRRRNKVYNSLYEWISAIVFAVIAATLIHLYVFQLYVIPTSSMQQTLLIGDYIYVSKLAYGPQVPNTPLSFPFVHHTMPFSQTKKSFSELVKWPYHRLAGLGKVERNDAVVFNFPAGDTVLLENQSVTYYDVLRDYERMYGVGEGRSRLGNEYTIISRPVDKRENYIKRCVGLPGDTVMIADTELYINGGKQIPIPGKQHRYIVKTTSPLSSYAFDKLQISEVFCSGLYYEMFITEDVAEQLRAMSNVVYVTKCIAKEYNPDVFPHDDRYMWSQDNFGPLWIPEKGATVELTADNLPLYERIITAYEGHELRVDEGAIYIDGVKTDRYTFAMDYYWMMGDNRHNSADSRFWGFVPEDHIVGKASFIIFSRDADGHIRWNRIFRKVR